jgi:hypothetical protein
MGQYFCTCSFDLFFNFHILLLDGSSREENGRKIMKLVRITNLSHLTTDPASCVDTYRYSLNIGTISVAQL